MAPSKQEDQRQMILHFWKQRTCNASDIHSLTKIPLKTIHRNLKKLDEPGDIKHKGGNGRHKKITGDASRAIGQYIRRNSMLSAGEIGDKLRNIGIQRVPNENRRKF